MARVYADVNQQMPRAYWDYDSVNISWGVLENYEVVRKIGALPHLSHPPLIIDSFLTSFRILKQAVESTPKFLRVSTWSIIKSV